MTLQREQSHDDCTIGRLEMPGFSCWTLEDVVRRGTKVYGATAIPTGRYEVRITRSVRFSKMLPLLLNIPGFEGVRIHPGNTSSDTEGCILVGLSRAQGRIINSRLAMERLMGALARAQAAGERMWITVLDPLADPPLRA